MSALPDWLIQQEGVDLPLRAVQIGEMGLQKSIHIGLRTEDVKVDDLRGFIDLGRRSPTLLAAPAT